MTSKLAKYALAAFLIAGGASAAHASPAPGAATPIGVWLFQNNRFAIQIDSCGDSLCGKVTWLKSPCTDSKNEDPALRSRPVLGITVLNGLHRTAEGTWEGGEIYNPDDGGHYQATLSMSDDGTLRVRAYEGVPLLGKTLRLTRMS